MCFKALYAFYNADIQTSVKKKKKNIERQLFVAYVKQEILCLALRGCCCWFKVCVFLEHLNVRKMEHAGSIAVRMNKIGMDLIGLNVATLN